MKASPQAQEGLLKVQELDLKVAQVRHARAKMPEIAAADEAQQRETAVRDQLVRAQTQLSDVQREVTRADNDVQLVRDRAARDTERLNSGQGSAKDLQALTHEVESLARRQAELEEIELEVMERAEIAQRDVTTLQEAADAAQATRQESEKARDERAAALDEELAQASAPRAELLAAVDDDALVALYEKLRDNHDGIGAAALVERRCQGCRLELNPLELQRIAKAPADEVLRCDECDRILVRT